MVSNYLKIAFRALFTHNKGRSPLFSWINIFGLTIGLVAFLLIGHFVLYQLSFDRSYPNAANIYRLSVERTESGEQTMASAKTYAGIGNILMAELPEAKQFVRILEEECMFHHKESNITFNRQSTFWADGNFHELLGLELVARGNPDLLHEPNHAIISQTAAERFFGTDWSGDNNPIGKTLYLNEHIPFVVQGVYEDLLVNSHMDVDFVVSYSTLMVLVGDFMNTVMPPGRNFVYNYVELDEDIDRAEITDRANQILKAHTGDLADNVAFRFALQPLTSIHLESHLSDELHPNGNKLFVMALIVAAFLDLFVAWINFINLATARALNRAKEVGIRKAIGARKHQLAVQFVVENLVKSIIASLTALAVVVAVSGYYEHLTGISYSLFSAEASMLWLIFVVVVLVGSLLASTYPALVISGFNPVKALKGKSLQVNEHAYFRKGLIVFQFVAALFLVTCTGVIYFQIEYMRKQDLGANLDQVLVLHSPRSMIGNQTRAETFERFRDMLIQNPDIQSVASGGCLPGEDFLFHLDNIQPEGKDLSVNWTFDLASVDENYLPTLGMEMIAGRNFDNREDEANKVIINATAARKLGFESPEEAVGKGLRIRQDQKKTIVGVVKDAHYEGLQQEIKPLMLTYGHDYEFGFFPMRVNAQNLSATIASIGSEWAKTYPKDPIDYFFLDTYFDRQYQDDQAFGKMFGAFAILAVIIAALGLFSLVSFTTYQKSKEIGIRKVLGAGVFSIVQLVTAPFFQLIIFSSVLTLPFSYFITSE